MRVVSHSQAGGVGRAICWLELLVREARAIMERAMQLGPAVCVVHAFPHNLSVCSLSL